MKINIDVFNLYDRACKVYRNICASETVKYILVQGVDKAWLSNAEYGHEMPPLAAEAVKILEKAEAGLLQSGKTGLAMLYTALSLLLGVTVVLLGQRLVR